MENLPWAYEIKRGNEKRKLETWQDSKGGLRIAGESNLGGQEDRGVRK